MQFIISHWGKGTSARCGVIKTHHSEIQTPVFMPIGTHGAVKTCLLYTSPSPRDRG